MPPGSPNLFRAEVGRNLNTVFPPQFGGFEVPVILGGAVSLTHDFPGTAPYEFISIYDNIGGVDVLQILALITPPPGFIWIVDEMSVQINNEPVARAISLRVRYPTPLGVFTVTVFERTMPNAAAFFPPVPINKRLILPKGAILDLSVPVLTAGGNLRWTLSYFQVGAGQFVPKN